MRVALILIAVAVLMPSLVYGAMLLEHQAEARLQKGPFLVIYPTPPTITLSVGGAGPVRVWVYNYGDEAAVNSTLYVYGGEGVNLTADGIKWGRNLTLNIGVISPGKPVLQTLFVRLESPRNASVMLTLLSDNADPAVAYFEVYSAKAQAGESFTLPLVVASAIVLLAGVYAYVLRGKKRATKRSKKPSKKR
ncbi:hypothetical protein [Infirmifilum sp. SLHALR2]|nr:MAG: hypothetical protein B7L53_03510 [Thermofilum sp. NZ13]